MDYCKPDRSLKQGLQTFLSHLSEPLTWKRSVLYRIRESHLLINQWFFKLCEDVHNKLERFMCFHSIKQQYESAAAPIVESRPQTVFVDWFDPPNPDAWVDNAQASLTSIAELYRIDGIDIDFEHFPSNYSTSKSTFSYCIGTLLQRLKGNNTIGIATIAPFDLVVPQYQDLVANYGDLIDYISFQFYATDLPIISDYVQSFRETTLLFDRTKLLASTLINGTTTITGRPFWEAVKQLQETDELLGVMLYDADASKSLNFTDEIGVLALIPGPYDEMLPAQAPPPIAAQGKKMLNYYRWRWHMFSTGIALVMYSFHDL